MRKEFVDELVAYAERDERVMLLTGDLGYSVIEPFAQRFPTRFLNVGVAEQNMVGVATGLADAGYIPFVWSIATFASMRAYEFVRNGPALHQLPVRIVGVGGGLEYGHNGVTHYALEDVAVMRAQPDVCVIAPADHLQTRAALRATGGIAGPVYFRLGKLAVEVPGLDGQFELGRLAQVSEGHDVAIVAMGAIAAEAAAAAEMLSSSGISARAGIVSSFNPSPIENLIEFLQGVPLVITVEGHYVVGGLGSLVAEVIADHGLDSQLARCGATEMPRGVTGSEEYLRDLHGVSASRVAALAERHLTQVRV